MTTKTQLLSSSRAGLASVVIADPGTGKTQPVSNVGVVRSPAPAGGVFIVHPFP